MNPRFNLLVSDVYQGNEETGEFKIFFHDLGMERLSLDPPRAIKNRECVECVWNLQLQADLR